jgi:hypothetical protein
MGNDQNIRDEKWTRNIDVGSISFVDRVKPILGSWPSEKKASNQEMHINFERLLLLMLPILGSKRAI